MTFRLSKRVLRQLSQINDFIAKDNEDAASEMLRKLYATFEKLAQFPKLGHTGRRAGTREFVQAPFVIVYRIASTEIVIVALFHAAKTINRRPDCINERTMATKKSTGKKTSSGSGPKSKRIVKKKMGDVMHEFKHHDLSSGKSGKKVKNPKQAIAIGLSEARRSGADIPPNPNAKKKATKKSGARKKAAPKKAVKKTAAKKKSAAKKR